MHKEISHKLKEVLETTDASLNEAQKYIIAMFIFLAVSVVGIFTTEILWLFGFLGSIVMWYFSNRLMQRVPRNMGFVDGIFFMQYHLSKELKEFQEDLNDDNSEIPKEVRDAIQNVKVVNKAMQDTKLKE